MTAPKKPWLEHLREKLSEPQNTRLKKLYKKGFSYWFRVVFLTILGVLAGQLIGQHDLWRELRYKIYHFQTRMLGPHNPSDLQVAFVLIGDDEYWTGPLARRSPIKRDYLAKLIRAVDQADPAVIALDFDLRSPTPNGSIVENPDYLAERAELISAVKAVAAKRPVVLPKSLIPATDGDSPPGEESDILDAELKGTSNIFEGYINFAPDLRMIPARVQVKGLPEFVDSLSLAVLRAYSPDTYELIMKKEGDAGEKGFVLKFGRFLGEEAFTRVSSSARDVLAGDPGAMRRLSHRIVLVGARWHRDGFGAGSWNDEHITPAGRLVGVYTHASYVEALRTGFYYPEVPEALVIAIEAIIVLGVSVLLVLDLAKWLKIALTFLPCIVILLLSYVLLQNLGLFFEFIIPVLVLVAHNIIDHLQWRKEAHA